MQFPESHCFWMEHAKCLGFTPVCCSCFLPSKLKHLFKLFFCKQSNQVTTEVYSVDIFWISEILVILKGSACLLSLSFSWTDCAPPCSPVGGAGPPNRSSAGGGGGR